MRPGMVLGDRYRLERPVGSGGTGQVWRAHDQIVGRVVAVKRLPGAHRPPLVAHPNVVAVYDIVDDDGAWLVMEFVPSRSLSALLDDRGRFTPSAAARIGAQVASALAAAHTVDITHGDVAPGNVLVGPDGTAKLADFELTRPSDGDAPGCHRKGPVVATPTTVAPEVINRRSAVPASDVFSLGATLYRAVEGTSVYGTGTVGDLLGRAARCDIAPARRLGALAPVIDRLLVRNPVDRPSAADTVELLKRIALAAAPG